MNIAWAGNNPTGIVLSPDVRMTGKRGQRVQMTFANTSPSMLPGMQISVITSAIEGWSSSTKRASSAEAQSIISRSSSDMASTVRLRRISSSSTISTVDVMVWVLDCLSFNDAATDAGVSVI